MSTALMTLLIICVLNKPIHIIGTPPDEILEDERGMGHNDEKEKSCDQEVETILNPRHNGQENNQSTATSPFFNDPTLNRLLETITPTLENFDRFLETLTPTPTIDIISISHPNSGIPEPTCLQTNNNPFNQGGNQSNSSYNQNQIPEHQDYLAQASSSANSYNQIALNKYSCLQECNPQGVQRQYSTPYIRIQINNYENFIKNKNNYLSQIDKGLVINNSADIIKPAGIALITFLLRKEIITRDFMKNLGRYKYKNLFERFLYNSVVKLFKNPDSNYITQPPRHDRNKGRKPHIVRIRIRSVFKRVANRIINPKIQTYLNKNDIEHIKFGLEKLVEETQKKLATIDRRSYTEIKNKKHRRQDDDDNGGGSNCFQFPIATNYRQNSY